MPSGRPLKTGAVERRANGRRMVNGAATANGVFRVLRALWNFAADRDDTLGRNPVGRLKDQWYPVPKREGLVKGDQLADFYRAIDALPNEVTKDYLLLLLFTGMRRGEAASLRWEDVDFGLRVIRLPAKRTKSGRKLDLPMTDFVHGLLVARPGRQPARRIARPRVAAGLKKPPAVRDRETRLNQHHVALGIGKAEREHFRHERSNLLRREIDHGGDLLPHQLLERIKFDDLRGTALVANCGTEIDREFVGRFARFGKRLGFYDGTHADFDLFKILIADGHSFYAREIISGNIVAD
jgi:integrase